MKQGSLVLNTKQVIGMERYEALTRRNGEPGMYRGTAENLLKFLMEKMPYTGKDAKVFSLGGRSGNFTIADLKYFDKSDILSLIAKEKDSFDAKAWLELAEVKFLFKDDLGIVHKMAVENRGVYRFLTEFRNEVAANGYNMRLKLINEDFFSLNLDKPFPIVVGHQFIHQFEDSEQAAFAEKVAHLTEKGGYAAFSSSMAFYVPTKFNVEEVSYLAHPFVQAYFEILARKIEKETGKGVESRLQSQKRTKDDTVEIFESKGLVLVKDGYGEIQSQMVAPHALFSFALRVAPENNGMFSNAEGMIPEIKLALMNEAIVDTVANHPKLIPTDAIPADVAPVFVFRKK